MHEPPPVQASPRHPAPPHSLQLNYQTPGGSPRRRTLPAHPIVAVAGAAAYSVLIAASTFLLTFAIARRAPVQVIATTACVLTFSAWRASDAILDLFRRQRLKSANGPP